MRIDPGTEPHLFRGATISVGEVDALRTIGRIVRGRRSCTSVPLRSSPTRVTCPPTATRSSSTARPGASARSRRAVFEPDRITLQYVTIGFAPWSAATVGAIEARHGDDVDRNRLCPPVVFTGDVADILELSYSGMTGLVARSSDARSTSGPRAHASTRRRTRPAHLDDPRPAAFDTIVGSIGEALTNLGRVVGAN